MRIIIYGGGGHAKTLLEYFRPPSWSSLNLIGVVDDYIPIGTPVMHTQVVANSLLDVEWDAAYNCIGGIAMMELRETVFDRLKAHGQVLHFLHPRAYREPSATIHEGAHLMAGAYVGPHAVIGANCIVNTHAVVSHDCHVGAHTHIAPGALLAGNVTVGEQTIIGMGVTIHVGVTIGDKVKIYNGTQVFKDILDQSKVPVPGRKH